MLVMEVLLSNEVLEDFVIFDLEFNYVDFRLLLRSFIWVGQMLKRLYFELNGIFVFRFNVFIFFFGVYNMNNFCVFVRIFEKYDFGGSLIF